MSDAIRQVMIRGRVQGVGYRAWVDHVATTRHLEGWVRNRRDGSVEALFAVREEAATSDALNLRRAGERFSVLPTI
jgi:acylphosphatase